MTSQKLPRVLQIIGDSLKEANIPYALIGALALSYYGLPKYTSDIDLLTEDLKIEHGLDNQEKCEL